MKIDKVIMSCNDNPFYHEYWPIISKVWKVKYNGVGIGTPRWNQKQFG